MTIPTIATSDNLYTFRNVLNTVSGILNNLGTYDAIVITGGSINGTTVGLTTPGAGKFTNLTATGTVDFTASTNLFTAHSLSGTYIDGGTIGTSGTGVICFLSNPPTDLKHATSKEYVDDAVSAVAGTLASVAVSGSYDDLSSQPNIFGTIAVATQSNVVANAKNTTVNFANGSNIAITTNAGTRTVTIGVTGLGSLAALSSINNSNWSGTALSIANGGTGSTSASAARTALGLGSLSTASSVDNSVWSGTQLSIANGGTGAASAAAAATALGLGTASLVQLSSLGLGVSAPIAGNLKVANTITYNAEYDNGTKTTTFAIDWRNGNKQKVTLGASSVSMTFTNPAGPCHLQLKIIQDGTGSRTKGTWPTILSPSGSVSASTLSTTASAIDILSLFFDGTNYWGQFAPNWIA